MLRLSAYEYENESGGKYARVVTEVTTVKVPASITLTLE